MNDKTKSLLAKIPFDEAFKEELLTSYDKLSQDQQLEIIDLIWLTYSGLYELKLEENLALGLEDAKRGGVTVEDFYANVHKKTDSDMNTLITDVAEETDLTAAREAMERIIKEMKAAKMPLKVD